MFYLISSTMSSFFFYYYYIAGKVLSSIQLLSCVRLFATPWIAGCQASLSITNSWSSLRLTSIKLVMPSSHLILCHPLLLLPPTLPASGSFPMSQLFAWGGQSIGVSASTSVPSMSTQGWSPSEWTGWISLQSKGLSRVFSNTTVQKHLMLSVALHYSNFIPPFLIVSFLTLRMVSSVH